MELGKTISDIRRKHDLTQEEFAEKFNVTRQTISNWENGKSYPDLETLVRMSEDFNISLDTMLKGDNRMVREITKEQKHGKKHGLKLILAFLAAFVIVAAAVFIMNNTVIGSGCELDKAIVAENVAIGDNVKLGVGEEAQNDTAPHIYNSGLVTVGEKSVIPGGVCVGKNSVVFGITSAQDYPDGCLASGKTLIKAGDEQ